MENYILYRAGLRRHKSSLTGIFVLMFLISVALGTVLTVWSNAGRYVSDEMERAGFGTLTAWVSNVPDMDVLTGEIRSLPDVTAVETQQIIFSNYTVAGQESDSEGQLITLFPGESRYRFFTDGLSAYRTDVPQIAPGEVYVSPSLMSMYGLDVGSEIVFPIARAGGNVTFTVRGFYEDPFMGSSMIGMKGFLICRKDHDALAEIIQSSGIDALARSGAMLHIFTEFIAANFGLGIGDTVTVSGDPGSGEYFITGICSCANDMGDNIGMTAAGYLRIGRDDPQIWCHHYFLADPGQKTAITEALEAAYGGDVHVHVHENTWPGLAGISNFTSAANLNNTLLPAAVVIGLFTLFACLTAGKIRKDDFTVLIAE